MSVANRSKLSFVTVFIKKIYRKSLKMKTCLKSIIVAIVSAALCCADLISFCTDGGTCLCPAEFPNQVGGCTSDEQPRCKDSQGHVHEGGIHCKSFVEIIPSTLVNQSTYGPESGSSWMCGGSGATFNCPAGKRGIGSCSSAGDPHCGTHCQPKSWTAQDCSPLSSPYQLSTEEGTWQSTSDGGFSKCPDGQVICGSCLSGKDADCSNGSSGRWKCCKLLDCTPTNVTGYWQEVYFGYGSTTVSVDVGVQITGTSTVCESYTVAVQKSVSTGFLFDVSPSFALGASVEVSGKFSQTASLSISTSLSASVHVGAQYSCSNFPGNWVLWQYRYKIDGACPSIVFDQAVTCSELISDPPCCLPGYAWNGTACSGGSPSICAPGTGTVRSPPATRILLP